MVIATKKICAAVLCVIMTGGLMAWGTSSYKTLNRGVDSKTVTEKFTDSDMNLDDQPYFGIYKHSVANGDDGYYFIENDTVYYLWQFKEAAVVCAADGCTHVDDSCVARLSRTGNSGYDSDSLYYYDGSLFVIYNDKSGTGKSYLERLACDGKSDEIIYSYTDKGAVVYAVKSYGNYLYFLTESYSESEQDIHYNGLSRYEYATGEVSFILDAQMTDYTFDVNNCILYYYVYNEGLYRRKLPDTSAKRIYAAVEGINDIAQISFINGSIYVSSDMNSASLTEPIYIYEIGDDGTNYREMKCFSLENRSFVFFGNGYIFARIGNEMKYANMRVSNSTWQRPNSFM